MNFLISRQLQIVVAFLSVFIFYPAGAQNTKAEGPENLLNIQKDVDTMRINLLHKKDYTANHKDVEKTQNDKKVHLMVLFSITMGWISMALLAGFVFRSYRIKNKTNTLLKQQKHQIENLNEELAAANEKLVMTKNLVKERENLLVQITDNIPIFISLVDNSFEYVFANSGYAGIFNLQKKDIEGRKVIDILSEESYEKVHPILVNTLKGEPVTFENSMLHEDGRQQILQTTYIPYYQHNEIQGLIVCSDDITDRKIADQLLKEIETEKAKLLAIEMERIGQELDSNQKSVTAATLKLIQNSERDSRTIEALIEIEENTNPAGKQKINVLIADYKRISYNSNWDEFEILFEKVHNSFYARLNARFPTLTANDRKICAFLKLNMSNKDIMQITFQSDEALKKARLRLRQKLEISREINLITFLQSI